VVVAVCGRSLRQLVAEELEPVGIEDAAAEEVEDVGRGSRPL
jgi:hypothetical protein